MDDQGGLDVVSSRSWRTLISTVVAVAIVVSILIVVIVVGRRHVIVFIVVVVEKCPFRRLRIEMRHREKTWSIDFNNETKTSYMMTLTSCWLSYYQCAKEYFFSLF